jgi:DNA-binding NtrC family response regulator
MEREVLPQRARVLVVDDEPEVLAAVSRTLERGGFDVRKYPSASLALSAFEADPDIDVVLTNLHLPEMSGMAVLSRVKEALPELQVVVMTGQGTISAAVQAMRSGAFDFVTKPAPSPEELRVIIQRAVDHTRLLRRNRYLERQLDIAQRFENVVAMSPAMRETMHMVDSVARTDSTVLIRGESGTGKEVIARAIHERSNRASRSFIGVNCGALTESVLESELFGHARGAFTGAVAARRGLFEQASGGTIFLDEIGEVSPAMQVRLLRVLEEGEIRPVGESQVRPVDARVLAATHQDLERAMREGRFRQDLFYRINVIAIPVAPLRQRREDLLPLAHHFLRKHARKAGKEVTGIAPAVAETIERYSWPGNARELSNAIERAVVLARSEILEADLLPPEVRSPVAPPSPRRPEATLVPFATARTHFEESYLTHLMTQANGNTSVAAELSGVDRSNLRRMLKRYGIAPDDFR